MGRARLVFSHIGYKSDTLYVEVNPNKDTDGSIVLKEQHYDVHAVEIKGRIRAMTASGDTIIYHAAAAQVFENDDALRVMEQMPGVVADPNRVTVMGEVITRTYVDGKMISGKDPMAALNNLIASDVIKIKVYDEYQNRSTQRRNRKNDKKERVINIETKSKLISAKTGHLLGSYGVDLAKTEGKIRDRYAIGATGNFFSEKFILKSNAYFNNINRSSNRIQEITRNKLPSNTYERKTHADIAVERNWTDMSLLANYSFNQDYSQNKRITERIYKPTKSYSSRNDNDEFNQRDLNRTHEASIMFNTSDYGYWNHQMVFGEKTNTTNQMAVSLLDGENYQRIGSIERGKNKSYDIQEDFMLTIDSKSGRLCYELGGNLTASNKSTNRNLQVDTLSSTPSQIRMEIPNDHDNLKFVLVPRIRIALSEEKSNDLSFGYSYDWKDIKNTQIAINCSGSSNPAQLASNSYNYTDRGQKHQLFSKLGLELADAISSEFNFALQQVTVKSDDRIQPELNQINKKFNAITGGVTINYIHSILRRASFTYATNVEQPSVEQLRLQPDNFSKINYIRIGNPDLKQSYTHNFLGVFSSIISQKNTSFEAQIEYQLMNNATVSQQTFYATQTTLPHIGEIPAMTTVESYANVNRRHTGKFNGVLTHPFAKWRGMLRISLQYLYSSTPYYIGSSLTRTDTHAPKLTATLAIDKIKNVKLNFGASGCHEWASGDLLGTVRTWSSAAWASININRIAKYLLFRCDYSYNSTFRSGAYTNDTSSHILNATIGCKLLKGRGELSITGYDLLNRNPGFAVRTFSDYVQNSWEQSFGRYVTINFGIKFNRAGSGISNASVSDGSNPRSMQILHLR